MESQSPILSSQSEKPKKFFKKWWFWVPLTFFIIGVSIFLVFYPNFFNDYNKPIERYSKPSCSNTMECDADTPEQCAANWLVKAGCISESYRGLHYSNFKVSKEEIFNFQLVTARYNEYNFNPIIQTASTKYTITYNYDINGETPCRDAGSGYKCNATILKSNNRFYLYSFYGPLKKYEMKYTREKVMSKFKGKIEAPAINSLYLDTNDQFSHSPVENYDPIDQFPKSKDIDYGLYWNASSSSGDKNCFINWIIRIDNGDIQEHYWCGI